MRLTHIVLFFVAVSGASSAATITYDGVPAINTGWELCGNLLGYSCETTAYFDANSLSSENLGGISPLFLSAFNAWNDTVDDSWTLENGGDVTGTLKVMIATAQEFDFQENGGVTIEVNIDGITPPTLLGDDQLVWVQGLYENYLLNGNVVAPFSAMDITSGSCSLSGTPSCPPAYPFQYSDTLFYDQPNAQYQGVGSTQAFFNANAYLAVEDPDARTLTVYDGISYGFQNLVGSGNSASPEPDVYVLCASGLLAIFLIARRPALQIGTPGKIAR